MNITRELDISREWEESLLGISSLPLLTLGSASVWACPPLSVRPTKSMELAVNCLVSVLNRDNIFFGVECILLGSSIGLSGALNL